MRFRGALVAAFLFSCGSEPSDLQGRSSDPTIPSSPPPFAGPGATPGTTTAAGCNSVRGKVYDPAGRTPLYGVAVYVPRGPLPPVPDGVSCGRCGTPISALAATMTDSSGSFSLAGVPDGESVHLVLETGKWRREVTLPAVSGCKELVADDPALMRLPRNASEGAMPHIAIVGGAADSLECLVRKIGISDAEFGTSGDQASHVHLYHGGNGRSRFATGKLFAEQSVLFGDANKLDAYDAVLAACAARVEDARTIKPAWVSAMEAYAAKGGRAFFSHFMNYFVRGGSPALASVATIRADDGDDLVDPFVADVNTSFPKGKLFSEWLGHVGASTTPAKVAIHSAQYTVSAVAPASATSWIDSKSGVLLGGTPVGPVVQYFSANMPAGAPPAGQCGRYVVSDLHVGSGSGAGDFPAGCADGELTPQEKVLEFMLFDLSSCVQQDSSPPAPPVVN